MPLYLILHVFTSPIAASSAQASATNVAVEGTDDFALTLSTPLAYGVPAVLMSLPSPGQIAPLTHYAFHALWQVYPVTKTAYHWALSAMAPRAPPGHRPAAPRRTYLSVLLASVISQVALVAVAVTPASVVPEAWAPVFADVTLSSAFVPCWPGNAAIVDASAVPIAPHGLAELTKLFLQWDIYCGGTAVLVWAVFVRSVAQPDRSVASFLPAAAFWTACGGPPAAAAMMLWERDEAAQREKAQ